MKNEYLLKKAKKIRNKSWSKRQPNSYKKFFKSLHLEEHYKQKYLKRVIKRKHF